MADALQRMGELQIREGFKMSENTKIEWCDHSWSPWRGCTKVSAGCAHCYAETLSKRNPAVLGEWGRGKPRVLAKNWNDPVKWNRRHKLRWEEWRQIAPEMREAGLYPPATPKKPTFFPSLCDWLDEEVPIEWLADFIDLIFHTPNLDWLLLTKRPENWRSRINEVWKILELPVDQQRFAEMWIKGTPPANVWVGTSVEDQPNAERRIPELLEIPAVGRFLSLEPLLGPVDIRLVPDLMKSFNSSPHGWHNWLRQRIQWLIIGGESGHGARPCMEEWIRSLVRQGKSAGVATFVKQQGAHPTRLVTQFDVQTDYPHVRLVQNHPKGGDPAEWPEDLRVREFPEGLR